MPAKTSAARHHHEVDANREPLGLGAANLAAGLFDTLPGLFIGISVSLLLLYRASRPMWPCSARFPGADGHDGDILRHPENQQAPGIAVLRLESGLFFANAEAVRDAVRGHAAEPGTRAVVLDAETIPFVDVTATRMLAQLGGDLEREAIAALTRRP